MSKDYNIYLKSQGKSMEPVINSCSELLISINKDFKYEIGDIVCFLKKNGLIVHRVIDIIKKRRLTYLLKGDNNIIFDGYYLKKDIYGKIEFIINNDHIINYKKGIYLQKLIAITGKISNLSPFRYIIFYFIKLLNRKTGSDELDKIIDALNNKKVIKTSKKIDVNLLHFLSIKNKFLRFNKLNSKENIQQQFFSNLLNKEKVNLNKLFQKNNINYVLLDAVDKNHRIYGSDIDILIDYEQLLKAVRLLIKNNFYIKNRPPQEITLVNESNYIQIDLHFLVNLPRDLYFDKDRSLKITKDYWKAFTSTQTSRKYQNEYFLLGKIICFWTNDFLRGLNTLFNIGEFIKNNQISWKDFEKIAIKHNFLGESQLVLLIFRNIFQKKYLDNYLNKVSLKIKILSHYYDQKKIGIFGSITSWATEDDENSFKIYIECFIASLLVNKKTPLLRLLRPRIIFFFIKSIFNTIANFFQKTMLFDK